jgi:hypothetical protein
MYMEPSYMYFCKKKKHKNQSLLSTVAIRAKFSVICQIRAIMVPEKFDVIKLRQFAQKTRCRVFAVLAMVVRPLYHCHIAAVTARYANELEAKIRRFWRTVPEFS